MVAATVLPSAGLCHDAPRCNPGRPPPRRCANVPRRRAAGQGRCCGARGFQTTVERPFAKSLSRTPAREDFLQRASLLCYLKSDASELIARMTTQRPITSDDEHRV